MLMLISPAKTLDFDTPAHTAQYSQPDFLDESKALIKELRALAPQDISALMKISDKLGTLNYQRFADWQTPFAPDNAKQAVLAFRGDVYTGLDADSMSDAPAGPLCACDTDFDAKPCHQAYCDARGQCVEERVPFAVARTLPGYAVECNDDPDKPQTCGNGVLDKGEVCFSSIRFVFFVSIILMMM